MTLLTMTIPDDPDELPRWLERRLMAPDFGLFIAELSAHFPRNAAAVQPCDLVDRWLPVALNEGLAPVPPEVLSKLLRNPAALAAFQERVVIDGGAYWDNLPDTSDELSERVERTKLSLQRRLAADASAAGRTTNPKARQSSSTPGTMKRTGARRSRIWAMVSTGVGACLAGVVVWLASSGPPPVHKFQIAWGWAKPGGLAADQSSPRNYLNQLATNVEEWSLYRPGDANGVSTRILELRLGCVRLMHSSYGPLSPDDKTWLLEHCREWAKTLDSHQQALDAGADPLAVRAAMDETVREIATTLRAKSKLVG